MSKSDGEILAHKRELDRNRAKKYYESKKKVISERRKIKRDEDKQQNILNLNNVIKRLEDNTKNVNTFGKYRDKTKILFKLFECDELDKILFNFEDTIKAIENFRMISNIDKLYGSSTKKEFYQMILIIIDMFNLDIPNNGKDEYLKRFNELKFEIANKAIEKIDDEEEAVYDFDEYLTVIEQKYGIDSKEYLISYLYYEITARDNFYLKIIENEDDIKDRTKNYLIYNSKMYIILYNYKTNKYDSKKYLLSDILSKLIKNYIVKKKLEFNDYLFNNKNLTQFIYNFNKKIDYKITINSYRHMKASKNLDTQEKINDTKHRVELAYNLGHTTEATMKYKRIIKPIIKPLDYSIIGK